jgi:hypothetical protein
LAFIPGTVQAQEIEKKGTAPYVTHFIFRPLETLEVPGVGTGQLYEMTGSTQNLKGEPMLDKMAARCTALRVETGGKKYIDGVCALTDKDGDVIMSTFDTRDIDKTDPKQCLTRYGKPIAGRDVISISRQSLKGGESPLGPQAAYLKSRCTKAKGSLRVVGKRRHEWRLNLQQQALPEIGPMSLLGLTLPNGWFILVQALLNLRRKKAALTRRPPGDREPGCRGVWPCRRDWR